MIPNSIPLMGVEPSPKSISKLMSLLLVWEERDRLNPTSRGADPVTTSLIRIDMGSLSGPKQPDKAKAIVDSNANHVNKFRNRFLIIGRL